MWRTLTLLLLAAASIAAVSIGFLESVRTKNDAKFSNVRGDWLFAIPFSAGTNPAPLSGRQYATLTYDSFRRHLRNEKPGSTSAYIVGGEKMSFLWFLRTPWIDESGVRHWIQEPPYGLGIQHTFLRVPLAYGHGRRALTLDRIEPANQPFSSTKVELPGNGAPVPKGKSSLLKMGAHGLIVEEIAPFAPGFRETIRLELKSAPPGWTYFVEAKETGGEEVYRAALDSSGKGFLSVPRLGARKIELALVRVDRTEVNVRLSSVPGLDLQRFLEEDGKEIGRFEELKSDPYRAFAVSDLRDALAIEIGECWFGNRYEPSGNPFPCEANALYFMKPDPTYKARIWREVYRVTGVLNVTLPAASYDWY